LDLKTEFTPADQLIALRTRLVQAHLRSKFEGSRPIRQINRFIFSIGGAILLTAIAYFATPYIQLAEIRMAAHRGDDGVLKLFIDQPSVRRSLELQLTVGQSGVGANVGKTADAYLSAKSLDLLLNGAGHSGPSGWTRMGYETPNRFVAVRSSPGTSQSGAVFTFERVRPFHWKLEKIDLPSDRP